MPVLTYCSVPKSKLSAHLPMATYLHSVSTEYTHNMDIDYGKLTMPFAMRPKSEYVLEKSQRKSGQEDCPETRRVQRSEITKIETTVKKRCKGIKVNQSEGTKSRPSQSRISAEKIKKKKYFGGSSKRKVQTRVLTTIVGGGKMQTKLIVYPDNRAYLRLCGLTEDNQ